MGGQVVEVEVVGTLPSPSLPLLTPFPASVWCAVEAGGPGGGGQVEADPAHSFCHTPTFHTFTFVPFVIPIVDDDPSFILYLHYTSPFTFTFLLSTTHSHCLVGFASVD